MKVNDFFCGCGGIGLGFMQAGFDVIWACDFDKFAVKTYRENVGNHVIQADIRELTYKDIPKADVWAFGFPCQSLSIAGKRDGFKFVCKDCGAEWNLKDNGDVICPDCGSKNYEAASRSGLFFEIMRLLDETAKHKPENMPKALFAENVKGLKKYIPVLEEEFKRRGYKAYIQLYDSKYWGVPQHRERYFIVGVLQRIPGFIFPEEQHEYIPRLSEILEDDVDEKYFISDDKAQTIIRQALERLEKLGKIHAVLTPDRINKRQNGRRAKHDDEEMFTLTTQDIHGVIIQLPRGNNPGGLHNIAPTLTGSAYQENNFVCEITENLKHILVDMHGVSADPSQLCRIGKYLVYDNIAPTLCARDFHEPRLVVVGRLDIKGKDQIKRIYSTEGLSPTLTAVGGGIRK